MVRFDTEKILGCENFNAHTVHRRTDMTKFFFTYKFAKYAANKRQIQLKINMNK